jgi:D-alanyl-D-alanine carboxypeptidase
VARLRDVQNGLSCFHPVRNHWTCPVPLTAARPWRRLVYGMAAALFIAPRPAMAEALLLVDVDSGRVLHAENATYPWYPASTTKLMTAYVILHAVKTGRITLDSLFAVSANAVAQQPTKMGFRAGTQVTVDNALKMLMVHSANDMAVLLAEGLDGSIEAFANEMTQTAQRLGMTQSSFVNPNGLPAEAQITSARDLAILARALIHDFPEYGLYWRIPAIKLGRRVMHNYNPLIDRYPGTDGMKTGFICAAGFNLVATATHGDRRLIAVVLGAPSSAARALSAAELFEKGFNGTGLSWLLPSLGTVDQLTPIAAAPPDLHDEICGKHKPRAAETAEEEPQAASSTGDLLDPSSAFAALAQSLSAVHTAKPTLVQLPPSMPPIEVFVGPPRKRPTLASAPGSGASAATLVAPAAAATPASAVGVPVPRPRPRS